VRLPLVTRPNRVVRNAGPRYELQHDGETTPLTVRDEEMYFQRIVPIAMRERGRRLRAAFPKLWAEHSFAMRVA